MSHTQALAQVKLSGSSAVAAGKHVSAMTASEVCGALLDGHFDDLESPKVKGLLFNRGDAAPVDPNAPAPAPKSRPLLDALKTMVAGMISEYGPQVVSWLGPFVITWLKGQLGIA